MAIIYAVPIIFAIIFYTRDIKTDFSYFKEKTLLKIGSIIFAFILIMIGNILVVKFNGNIGITQNQQMANSATSEMPIILSILLFGIAIPFIEEIIFRHILIGKLSTFFKNIFCNNFYNYLRCNSRTFII